MKEIALFGVRYYADGTQETKLIRSQRSTGKYEQGMLFSIMCLKT